MELNKSNKNMSEGRGDEGMKLEDRIKKHGSRGDGGRGGRF